MSKNPEDPSKKASRTDPFSEDKSSLSGLEILAGTTPPVEDDGRIGQAITSEDSERAKIKKAAREGDSFNPFDMDDMEDVDDFDIGDASTDFDGGL